MVVGTLRTDFLTVTNSLAALDLDTLSRGLQGEVRVGALRRGAIWPPSELNAWPTGTLGHLLCALFRLTDCTRPHVDGLMFGLQTTFKGKALTLISVADR